MKTPKTDPEQEELTRLKEALSKHKSLLAEAEEFRTLQSTIGGEVEIFANSGDLRNTSAVSAIAVKQLQSSLIEKRIASLGTKLSESDAFLTEASATVARLLITDLHQIKNAVTEQAAQAMKPHFQDYQDCGARRQDRWERSR